MRPAVGFRNETKFPIIVQGSTMVNGMPKRGQLIQIAPGKIGAENNVPAGDRVYTVYDGQGQQVYIQNFPVRVQNADFALAIRIVGGKFTIEPAR
jgi:hypothetical protein